MQAFSILMALTTAVAAIPTSSKSSCTSYTDTYDELTANILLPQLSPVNTYHGLEYGAFVVSQPSALGGVMPKSKPNVAAATMQEDMLQLGSLSINPFGTISAASSKYFDLSSFYFGCVLDTHTSVLATSEACTIAVTGFTYDGKQVPEQTFAFAPTSLTSAGLNLATFPASYSKLKNITIGIANGAILTAQTVLIVDNFLHCNYN